jgi:glycosyltransferase involved in cell wall biosynthesis
LHVILWDQKLRDRLAAQGRAWAVEQFDWDHIAKRYAALFVGLQA